MFYKSEYCTKDGTVQIYYSQIFGEQYEKLNQATQTLITAMNEMDYCFIVLDSIKDFLSDCATNGVGFEKNFIRANRYLLNWLNSFYTWIEYHENNFKFVFSNLKKKYYEQSFSYRLAYNLRKYVTHCALVITQFSYDVINGTQNIQIFPSDILETEKGTLQASVRRELQERVANNISIDVVNLTRDFMEVFKNFQKDIWSSQESVICKALNYISQFVPLTSPYCYNCVIISDDRSKCFPIGQILEKYIKKVQEISSYID